MAAVTIRNIPDATHRALKLRAAQNSRSAEAEIRAILEGAVRPVGQKGLGTMIAEIFNGAGLTDAEAEEIVAARVRRPSVPMTFE